MEYEIIHLPKEKWKGTIIPIKYKTHKYYDVIVNKIDKGFTIEIEKKDFTEPVIHTPEEYDFPDKLYEDHWENAYAWGVLVNDCRDKKWKFLLSTIHMARGFLWAGRIY